MQQPILKGLCDRCVKKRKCKAPCGAVETLLREGNNPFYEAIGRDSNNRPIRVLKSKAWRYEKRECDIVADQGSKFDNLEDFGALFTTDDETPFESFKPKLNQTAVFIYRFFLGKPYEDIAEMMGVTVDTVVSHYRNAKDRMLEALKFLDDRQATMKHYKTLLRRNDESFGRLTKGQRWFIMNRVLGLTVPEIAKMEGATAHRVNHAIKEVSDRIKIGQVQWLECSEEDREQARQRIEAKRARDRRP